MPEQGPLRYDSDTSGSSHEDGHRRDLPHPNRPRPSQWNPTPAPVQVGAASTFEDPLTQEEMVGLLDSSTQPWGAAWAAYRMPALAALERIFQDSDDYFGVIDAFVRECMTDKASGNRLEGLFTALRQTSHRSDITVPGDVPTNWLHQAIHVQNSEALHAFIKHDDNLRRTWVDGVVTQEYWSWAIACADEEVLVKLRDEGVEPIDLRQVCLALF
jgi:hypothetical protein